MRQPDQDNDSSSEMMSLAHPHMAESSPISAEGKDSPPEPQYPSAHLQFDHPVDFPKGEFHSTVVGHIHREEHDTPANGPHKHSYHVHLKAMHLGGLVGGKASPKKAVDSADVLERRIMGDARGQ